MGALFLGLEAPLGRSWAAFWASWDCLGRSQERIKQTFLSEDHFFENSLVRFLEPSLALLGSSWRLLGRSWSQKGSQNGSECESKMGPKTCQKTDLNFSGFLFFLGAILGSKTGGPGTLFWGVPGRPTPSTPSSSGLHLGAKSICFSSAKDMPCSKLFVFHQQNPCHVHLGPILAPPWRHLGPL